MQKPSTNSRDARGKWVTYNGEDLTPMQRLFVQYMVRHGSSPTQAAKEAGYIGFRIAGYDLMRLPHIIRAVEIERRRYISGELTNIATGTLKAILTDKKAPAAARVQAARTIFEIAGELGKNKDKEEDDRPLSEMTAGELAGLIDKWTAERAALAKPLEVDEVEVLDPTEGQAVADAASRADLGPKSA